MVKTWLRETKVARAVVLAEVVGVGCAAGSAIAVGPSEGVEADQAQVLVYSRIHAGDELVLLEDRLGIDTGR